MRMDREPSVAVGLREGASSVTFHLRGAFVEASGTPLPAGAYRAERHGSSIRCSGPRDVESDDLVLTPHDPSKGRFSLETVIGVDFHWQQDETQTFSGDLRLTPWGDDRITVINDLPLETYLTSVICSEMDAASPLELIKAHSVISRSWILAQREGGNSKTAAGPKTPGERIRWYDHEAHHGFDVCADDHCQRYHGVGRIQSPEAHRAIHETRGEVLVFRRAVCDARYSKCCGGITEDARTAWSDEQIPYLVPLVDGSGIEMPRPPLTDEAAMRDYVQSPPRVYCNCTDESILTTILTPRDRETRDFFRWTTAIGAERVGELLETKAGVALGRIRGLEPVERGLSGRITRIRFRGDDGEILIGKELEIRRVLSSSHLLSSAFVIDAEGPLDRPETFVLRGAGWGHGVGLCQIGAGVMAWRGLGYEAILAHYYPGTSMERFYT